MIPSPSPDSELDRLYKTFQAHSHGAGLRAVYEQGMADFKAYLTRGQTPTVQTIDGPNGPDAPFVPTKATPSW